MRLLDRSILSLAIYFFAGICACGAEISAQTFVDITPDFVGDSVKIRGVNSKGDFCGSVFNRTSRIKSQFVYYRSATDGLSAGLHFLADNTTALGVSVRVYDIGEDGVVVGGYGALEAASGGVIVHAAKWVGGTLTDLDPGNTKGSIALRIVDNGLIGGAGSKPAPNDTTKTLKFLFTTSGSGLTEFTQRIPCSPRSYTLRFVGMNNNGELLGREICGLATNSEILSIWSGGVATEVAKPEGFQVYDLTKGIPRGSQYNSSGQIIGVVKGSGNQTLSYGIVQNGSYTVMPSMVDSLRNQPICISDDGQIGGTETVFEGSRAVPHGTLYLPVDAMGLSAGVHDLNSVVTDPALVGGFSRIKIISFLHSNGTMIVEVGSKFGGRNTPHILKAASVGLVVNSTGDGSDMSPGDGACATSSGDCTLRAAIEEANATAGLNTIKFNIPGSGVPSIQVGSSLPEITDSVVIDGSTQPSANRVEINGALALSADGLTISAGKSEIRHLLINNFAGDGLVLLTGDSNSIGNVSIGVGTDGVEDRGNDGYGIFILNSSGNKIGDAVLSRKNIIAHNGQSGVFIESGTGNTIRGNSIFSNSELGIDLSLKGVTENDIGDGDSGANSLQNYPVIDSVKVGLVSTIWGSLSSIGGQTYDIDIYLNDSCDTSGFGEGKKLIQSAPVFVDAAGTAEFAIQAVVTPSLGQFLSATATDRDGNTSEFSASIPALDFVRLIDVQDSVIGNKKFAMYKVANDRPIFTEVFVDSVTTDGEGIIDLSQYDIAPEDSLRFSRQLKTVLSPKRIVAPKTAYSVNIDNARFDSASSQMSYFEMPSANGCGRDVVVGHTTVAFNLYVSIEFDATVAYVNNLREAFRRASNYLYDVTDGQARFDTVVISDNRAGWNIADVWIHASNMEWPRAIFNGLLKSGATDRFYMPRKFFGTSTANRNMSAQENPLNPATPNNYRTFIHELGHYALKFGDEYVFINVAGHCGAVGLYGFMESQYAGRNVARSEMSQASMYSQARCRNTNQYDANRNSCWETFDSTFQKSYDGVFAPIIMPNERAFPAGQTFLLGPNNNLASPDVNIGAKIVFPGALSAPGIPPQRYRLIAADGVTPAGNVAVSQHITSSAREVKQGKTADNGLLYFMGTSSAYTYTAEGVSSAIAASPGAHPRRITDFSWLFGAGAVPVLDTGSIFLSEVQGELPLIPSVTLTPTGMQYSLKSLNQFIAAPAMVTKIENQLIDSSEMTLVGNVYRVTIPDTSSTKLEVTVHATDNASQAYFFSSELLVENLNESGSTGRTAGLQADFSLRLDSLNAAAKQIILTTDYPPIRNGLTPAQLQAGKVGVVQAFPSVSVLSGTNTLQIRYQEGSAESNGIDSELELTLRIHHWDETLGEWALVGGSVDTSQNEVSAEITELGTYALFTTDIQTDVDDINDGEIGTVLPKHFEVYQNFPNPFNPTTVISYSLPVRAEVTIAVYNVLGQRVKFFDQSLQSAGQHSVTWDAIDEHGKSVASGMYFYKVTAGDFSSSRKMVLLK
ncbi:T9SS type A sorting domain-containing protein [bacterium AH-315-J21]|nr:T9SS type A sorting domain-containing protein [bacterium AH-315-J21]